MIKYREVKMRDCETEGFGVSTPAPLTLHIEQGFFNSYLDTGIEGEHGYQERKKIKRRDYYPAVEFDVEPDPDFPVIYDVFLLEQPNEDLQTVHIERTILGMGSEEASYSGKIPLIHSLITFTIPPGVNNLEEVDIYVNNVVEVI